MNRTEYETKSQRELDPIVSVLVDGPKTAAEVYSLSGLGGCTGRALGQAVQDGLVTREGDRFQLSGRARLDLLVMSLDLN